MSGARILMISGSVRDGSVNAAVLRAAAELLPDGASAVIYDGMGALPHFNPDLDREPLPPAVVALRAAIADASALLFSTPEYAGAMPGALKNLLEWTVGGVEISGKRAGWINPSSSPTGASGTYESLATVLKYTDAAVVEAACVAVPVARSLVSPEGRITDSEVRARIRDAVAVLATE
jgi:NAD(P)H-dependent FMN reductase